jgi:hypothetical protein
MVYDVKIKRGEMIYKSFPGNLLYTFSLVTLSSTGRKSGKSPDLHPATYTPTSIRIISAQEIGIPRDIHRI